MPSLVDLVKAVKNENLDEITLILNQTYSLNEIDANRNAIYEAMKVACSVQTEKSQLISQQLLQAPQLQNTILSMIADNDNELLLLAIENDHKATAQLLLTHNSVKAKAHYNSNEALELACKKGDTDTVALLLGIKAVFKKAHTNKNFALIYAAQYGHLNVVKLLLTVPKVTAKASTCKNAAIGAAAYGNHLAIVELLLTIANVKEKIAIKHNQVLKSALEGNATETLQYLLTIDAVRNKLLMEPELLIELCSNNALFSYLVPIVMQMEFYGFTLNKVVIPSAATNIFTNTQDILRFFNDPVSFTKQIPLELTFPLIVEAIKINEVNGRVQQLESAYKTHSETAMSARTLSAAKIGFAKAQQLYQAEFDAVGKEYSSPLKAIEYIERNIRDMILKSILNQTTDENLQLFIKKNHEKLLSADDSSLMERAREFFKSNQNINHIAWRAYDPFAPVGEWPNLLTPPTKNATIFAAGVDENQTEIDLISGSYDVRFRIALYYLALKDIDIKPLIPQDVRESIFIGQIADIRRAHNSNDTHGIDDPSCYPGTVGRIATMGAGHPELQLVDPITELSHVVFRLLNNTCGNIQGASPRLNEKICLALTALNQYSIEMLKDGKSLEFNLTTAAESLSDRQIVELRRALIEQIGTLDEVFDKINKDFQQRSPVIRCLVDDEKVYVERQLVDICYNGVGNKIAHALRPQSVKAPPLTINCDDPFKVKLIEKQLNEVTAKARMLVSRSYANDEIRVRMSLEMAQCQHEIYSSVYPKLIDFYNEVDKSALAAFAMIIANLQFKQYDSVNDMHSKWHEHDIPDYIFAKAALAYQSDPLPAWAGPPDLGNLIDHFKVENLRKSFKML